MARIKNIEIPDHKHISISLTSIYGIGRSRAITICKDADIDPTIKTKDLNDDQLNKIRVEVDKYILEGDLRREIAFNIKRLMEIGSYRGIRHRRGLPVRGQSSKQNARTRKGPKRTVANKKKASK